MSVGYWRVILFLILLGSISGLLVWLIRSFLDLYRAVEDQVWLGSLLIGLLILILAVFLAATIYYLFLFRKAPPAPPPVIERPALPQSAAEKVSATQKNLARVSEQLEQIQNQVARQALGERSALLSRELAHPTLKVVVFGTGSAGKTSLVNALLGRTVGEVGAVLGTTTAAALYRWQLPGIPEAVEIVDSPGILEIGQAGVLRELEARKQAETADLLLVVTDGDLRQSEYEPLMELVQLGKRSLLILNKMDRYSQEEQALLLARLRERVHQGIAYEDVLLAAAAPTPVMVKGSLVTPRPQIRQVRDRIQAILYAEGQSLAIDNALLQSEQLGEEARRIIGQQLQKKAEQIVERFQWIVTGIVFANPIPAVDLLAIAAINAQMVVEIGGVYGCQMNFQQGRELALSLAKTLASLGLVEGAIQLTTGIVTALAEVTVVGYLVTAPIQAASAGYLTRIAGRSFIEYFQRNQAWGEGGMQATVQAQVARTQASGWLQTFVQEASQRVFRWGSGLGSKRDN
ncbi:MAG: GTP-binding protein [Cyanobacteriota bacterium]|nr:GTP-binding protein [Cyanobacteriota bacterium]